MKWLIASDLHGSAFYTKKLLALYQTEKAERMLLLGDLLYHGPRNDLPTEYDPKAVIAMLNPLAERLLCIRGNCDAEVDQMVLSFPILADYAVLTIGTRLIYATHGHIFNQQSPPPLCKGDILLHGHTHIPACEPFSEQYYLNPGSVSIPKEQSPHSCMILENDTFIWKNLDGKKYKEFTL